MQKAKKAVLKQVKIHTKHNNMLLEMRNNRLNVGTPNCSKQGIVAELIIEAYEREIKNSDLVS